MFNRATLRWVTACVVVAVCATGASAKKKDKAAVKTAAATTSAPAASPSRMVTISGVVFEDRNADGRRDAGEPALADMPVTNGVEWRKTEADGRFTFKLDESVTGTVSVCTPAGWRSTKQFYVGADFSTPEGQTQSGDIGLTRDAARSAERFTFVQVTDTHVTDSADTIETMMGDLGVINRVTDPPAFVVATGDLTNVGAKIEQMIGYAKAIKAAQFPYYNVVGNHDYGGKRRKAENYELYLSPRYYSFTLGRYHFIARDSMADGMDPKAGRIQRQWIEDDIRLNGAGKRVIVFQHFIPTNPELDWFSTLNTAAVFSGHWHGRREREYKGILDVNSAPLRFGGIDRSPRGFRIIHVDGDELRCEWRAGQQDKRVEVVHPATGSLIGGDSIALQALAYDSAVTVTKVHYRLSVEPASGGAAVNREGELSPTGRWMWSGRCPIGAADAARHARLSVEAEAADGTKWQAQSEFTVGPKPAPQPRMGEPWRFFHNDAGHRGFVNSGPRPPLAMSWATNVDGTILLASPVTADGKVYVGTGFRESLEDCAVHALDLVTGKVLWRAPVDSSIQHSLAVWEDNVLAVSQAATLYCFDSAGHEKWNQSLAREESNRWELSFPVTDGRAVYAGRCNGFGAYELASGKPLWRQPGGADWWPSVYSGPSIGTGMIYQGGPFTRALDPSSGKIMWNLPKTVVSTVAVVPAVVERSEQGDRLYVFQNDKTLMCLDGKSGATVWQASNRTNPTATGPAADAPLGNETGTPAVGEDVVCIGGGEVKWPGDSELSTAMHGFDKQTGRLLWRYKIGTGLVSSIPYKRGESTVTSSPVIVGDVVYFGASDGVLHALEVRTGKPLWQYRLGVPIASTVAVTGNTVVVAAWDGTIYAFTSAE